MIPQLFRIVKRAPVPGSMALSLALALFAAGQCLAAKVDDPLGQVKGVVLDALTEQPLAGANVVVVASTQGASTDIEGRFLIQGVPAAVHNLKVSMLGYETRMITDVVVREHRSDPLRVKLTPGRVTLEEVVVRPEYFSERGASGAPTAQFNREEIRRAAGSAEDVNRIVQALPSVGMGGADERNDLIVRGGNPMENLFLVDGHPVQNINHFGSQGGTGGPIGMIHVDFVDDVRFSPGGFDARYGDRLSSVMDIRFRDGSRERLQGEAFMSMAGVGVEVEGPLGERGSWLAAGRRSYLELLKEQIGYASAPVFGDLSGKFVYDLGPRLRLSGLFISGLNGARWSVEEDPDQNFNVDQIQWTVAAGLALRRLVSPRVVDHYRATLGWQDFDQQFSLWTGDNEMSNVAVERTLTLEAQRYIRSPLAELRFGLGTERALTDHDVRVTDMSNTWGVPLSDLVFERELDKDRAWAYGNAEKSLWQGAELRLGLRLDHDAYLETWSLQPRLGLHQRLAPDLALDLGAGLYTQSVPVVWLVQSDDNREFKPMRCRQLQAGLEWKPRPEWLLTLDTYYKYYDRLPVSEYTLEIPLADVGSYYGYSNLGELRSAGEGRSYGCEFFAQKKLSENVYGSASYSWSLSRYRTDVGQWETGPFDRRHMFTLIAGVIPSNRWEISLKWRMMGGVPVTPIDETLSEQQGDTRYRMDEYNGKRLNLYHRLDLRLDHRIHGRKMDIVMFWDIENAYDRKNEAFKYWHRTDGIKTWYGWRIMPVFGITLEF